MPMTISPQNKTSSVFLVIIVALLAAGWLFARSRTFDESGPEDKVIRVEPEDTTASHKLAVEEPDILDLLNEFESAVSANSEELDLLAVALDNPEYSKRWFDIGRYLIFYGNDEKYYEIVMDFILRRDVEVAPGDDLHTAYTAKVFLIGELGLLGDKYEDFLREAITIEGASRLQDGWDLASLQLPKPYPREMPDYRGPIMDAGIAGLALHPKQKHKDLLFKLYDDIYEEAESAIVDQITLDKENVFYTSPQPWGYYSTVRLAMLMLALQEEMGWNEFLSYYKKEPSFDGYIRNIDDYMPQQKLVTGAYFQSRTQVPGGSL